MKSFVQSEECKKNIKARKNKKSFYGTPENKKIYLKVMREINPHEICNECGKSVTFGSGRYANRVPDFNDLETRLEMGKPFPKGEFICSKCDNENTFQLSEESAEPSITISDLCKIWNELYGENFKNEYRGVYKRITKTI